MRNERRKSVATRTSLPSALVSSPFFLPDAPALLPEAALPTPSAAASRSLMSQVTTVKFLKPRFLASPSMNCFCDEEFDTATICAQARYDVSAAPRVQCRVIKSTLLSGNRSHAYSENEPLHQTRIWH